MNLIIRNFPSDMNLRLRIICLKQRKSTRALVTHVLAQWIEKYEELEKKSIAKAQDEKLKDKSKESKEPKELEKKKSIIETAITPIS